MTAKEVLAFAERNNVRIVDLRFCDLPGLWHHVSFPMHVLDLQSFEDGFGIDGSSIRGWAAIHESDMLLVPDPSTAILDPFRDVPTMTMVGDIIDPITKQQYPRDPRFIAKKAEAYLGFTGLADTAYVGAAAEFFINSERAFIQVYRALQHAREENRHDSVALYTQQLTTLVEATSYSDVIDQIRKDLA